jgi:hypothetical protein
MGDKRSAPAAYAIPPQNTKGALFSAPHRVIYFFLTLYIQNSISQRVNPPHFANLFLPRNQQLAEILAKMPP